LRRVLHAGAAWAPGGQISKYEWDFGDGQSASAAGHASSFMVAHDYAAAGSYRACLTVTDDQGRTAQKCLTVKPGT
jgi:PKD repeat protein